MTWAEVSQLKGDKGNRVLLFEEVLRFCRDNGGSSKLQVWISTSSLLRIDF